MSRSREQPRSPPPPRVAEMTDQNDLKTIFTDFTRAQIYLATALAMTLQVRTATGAQTPWLMNAFAMAVGIMGMVLDRPWISRT